VVATDLGISLAPVEMSTEDAESPFAWSATGDHYG
jgi:hypothetical protein